MNRFTEPARFPIQTFFQDVINQNRNSLRDYFLDDAVIIWPNTSEQFTADEYVMVNCDYPGSWCGNIERVEYLKDMIIMAARVFSEDESSSNHVVSFINLKENKISQLVEYWGEDGEIPQWRRKVMGEIHGNKMDG